MAVCKSARIPAWRKLGLCLKSENSSQTVASQSGQSQNGGGDGHRKKKRRLEAVGQSTVQSKSPGKETGKADKKEAQSPSTSASQDVLAKPRTVRDTINGKPVKRVSFTFDTKAEDGESAKTLISTWDSEYEFQQQLLRDHEAATRTEQFEPAIKARIEAEQSPDIPAVPKPKSSIASEALSGGQRDSSKLEAKLKTPNSANSANSKSSSKSKSKTAKLPANLKPHSALEYLRQHYESRETWKFNKNKEVWIVKNLFDLEKIPAEYDMPLSEYLEGIKSVKAREGISQKAKSIIGPDIVMECEKLRQEYHEQAVGRYKRKLQDTINPETEDIEEPDLAKRRRAEIIEWSLNVPKNREKLAKSVSPTSKFTPEPPMKKRKNRTSVVEISSSESDSDIDRDTDKSTTTEVQTVVDHAPSDDDWMNPGAEEVDEDEDEEGSDEEGEDGSEEDEDGSEEDEDESEEADNKAADAGTEKQAITISS